MKDIKTLSNSELSLYKKELENEYDSVKNKILTLCEKLETIDKEYNKINKELSIRQGL